MTGIITRMSRSRWHFL